MSRFCPKLCCVPGRALAVCPARDSDRLIKWFIGAYAPMDERRAIKFLRSYQTVAGPGRITIRYVDAG
jgi:hypothetical protein